MIIVWIIESEGKQSLLFFFLSLCYCEQVFNLFIHIQSNDLQGKQKNGLKNIYK